MSMNNGGGGVFPFLGMPDGEQNLKAMHDHYDVYVNDDFVGEKVLVTPSDEIEHLASYLHSCKFDGFTTKLDGDHYHIQADSQELANAIKGQLNAYLQTR